jgi:ribonuclease Z
LEVVLLGTGAPFPHPDRAGPSTLVRAGGLDLLFDTGRGVLMRLAALGRDAARVRTTFLTHLHSDHTTDFNDLVTMRWLTAGDTKPLRVVGPPGTDEFCAVTTAALQRDIEWRMEYTPLYLTGPPAFAVSEVTDGPVFEEDGVRVIAAPTEHPPVSPTIGFRIEHEGASVVIAGDTVPCAGLDSLCAGADIYVQTVFRPALMANLLPIMRYHSSTEDAARTAARGGVRTLVFTHMMPAPAPGTDQDWINDAKPHFDGEVIVGSDLLKVGVT